MTALCILKMDLHDPEAFKQYMANAPQTVIQYGGRHFSRGGRTATLEGPENTVRNVLIEFDSIEAAQAWYNSPEYQAAKKFRDGGVSTCEIYVVEKT
jgi:uncharacterized protein (DUF1330 family)